MGGRATAPSPSLVVDVEGFEGPLDLLLALARSQKVDLREVSLLRLAEQYLHFVRRAADLRLDLAAEYLVMAAWLAYLKSRLLLPDPPPDAEAEEDAARHARDLVLRLARLDALRGVAALLLERPRLGAGVFARGASPEEGPTRELRLTAGLHDLLAAYARVRTRDDFRPYAMDREGVTTMDEALALLRPALAGADWADLAAYLPPGLPAGPRRRSALASSFAAALELVRDGHAELRQAGALAPVLIRGRDGRDG